jgi:hypothetical protein
MMANSIITKVIEQMIDLPNDFHQQALTYILSLRQEHLHESVNCLGRT